MVRPEGVSSIMRVLVTGHRGYIGSVLVTVLRHARYDVVGLDCDFYEGCDFGRVRETIPSYDFDLRDIESADLLSFDAVIHLAALPEDSSGEFDPDIVSAINEEATIRLAECCKEACVSRFLFASACSVYGRGGNEPLHEQCPPAPTTSFAASKLDCERELARLADHTFTPVFLRNAGVYGMSPRLRMDLIVNEFVASAIACGRVVLTSDGRAWRSLIHVEDIARAYAAVLTAPDELVHNKVFNVARTDENHRLIDVADMVTDLVPQCTRSVNQLVFDEPSYRIDGSKLKRTFPKLSFRWTLPIGIRQLRNAMFGSILTPGDLRSDRYRRALRLKTLMEHGDLDAGLRRTVPALV